MRILVISLLLSGCSSIVYEHGTTKVSDTAFLVSRQIGHIEFKDGKNDVVVDQANTDETQVVGVAIKSAIQALK